MIYITILETKLLQQLKLTVSPLTVFLLLFCLFILEGLGGITLLHSKLLIRRFEFSFGLESLWHSSTHVLLIQRFKVSSIEKIVFH